MNTKNLSELMTEYSPNIRAEKTGTVKDDFRVLMAGILFLILMILLHPFMFKVWDWKVATRPFVFATVEIFADERHERPMILYDADANQNVSGTWTATIHDAEDDARLVTRKGQGNYTTKEDLPKLWTWSAWFDNGQDVPAVPNRPFYVCVRYDVRANDSGVNDESDAFCSAPFDPSRPRFLEESESLGLEIMK